MKYSIYEGNIERLESKLTRIQNKCKKYGCDFKYSRIGEEFKDYKDPETKEVRTLRYITVDVEGVAVVNNWKFVSTIEHTEKGNILRSICDVELPREFYTCAPYCEHCKSKRFRKDTFIVQNTQTGEFKQVGRNCLADFTHGLSAEAAAEYISAFDSIIEEEAPMKGAYTENYYNTEKILRYAYETVKYFGYVKSNPDDERESTKGRTLRYYLACERGGFGLQGRSDRNEAQDVGIDVESKDAHESAKRMLNWISGQEESNDYMHNLKTVCSLEYISYKDLGILVSLIPTYNREVENQILQEKIRKEAKVSQYVGKVGDKIQITVDEVTCLSCYDGPWGYSYFYKIVDTDGNIFVWSTSTGIQDNAVRLTGKVKDHQEYEGAKQTVLTRCKITYKKEDEIGKVDDSGVEELNEALRTFYNF